MSSGESKNQDRTIGSMSKVCRRQSSERAGCLEIGLEDKGENGTKEMNEKIIKTPIVMKNFVYYLVQQYKVAVFLFYDNIL